jgi:hypothetical protein
MGWRFHRSVRIVPGLRLNFSKRGVSASVGQRGAWATLGRRGVRTTVGLPGSGLSYTTTSPATVGRVVSWLIMAAIVIWLAYVLWLAYR